MSNYRAVALSKSPLAYYGLDNQSVADLVGSNALTASGSTISNAAGIAPGSAAATIFAGGQFTRATLTGAPMQASRSYAFWMRIDSLAADRTPLTHYTDANNALHIFISAAGDFRVRCIAGGTDRTVGTGNGGVTTGEVYHVGIIIPATGRATLTLNGAVAATANQTNFTAGDNFCIGSRSGSIPFNGAIDELGVFPLLTTGDMAQLYASRPLRPPLLIPGGIRNRKHPAAILRPR